MLVLHMISPEEKRLVDALREYSEGRMSSDFPFDDMKFTIKSAADEIERLAAPTPAPEPQSEVAVEPVAIAMQIRLDLASIAPREAAALWAKPGVISEMNRLVAQALATPPVVEEAVKADAWQDIATAPKDGTPFLIAKQNSVFRARWFGGITVQPDGYSFGWELSIVDGWKPLPATPSRSATP